MDIILEEKKGLYEPSFLVWSSFSLRFSVLDKKQKLFFLLSTFYGSVKATNLVNNVSEWDETSCRRGWTVGSSTVDTDLHIGPQPISRRFFSFYYPIREKLL